MGWATRKAAIVLALAVATLACGEAGDEGAGAAALEQARQDLLDAVDMQPLANSDEIKVGSVKSKTAPRLSRMARTTDTAS